MSDMKRLFITGGTRGIGKATVLAFLHAGWKVGFCYRESTASAECLVCEGNGSCFAYPCDLAKMEQVDDLAKKITDDFGIPDVLVNNAGIGSYGLFQDLQPDAFDELFHVNFKSAYYLSAKLVPGMIRRGSGRIINIASVWGEIGASCEVAYSASKAAMIGFTKALAKELAPSSIPVNAIAPGVVDTDMMARFTPEEKKGICEGIPAGRFVTPEEIAQTILFLAEYAPLNLTGQIIGVNGSMI